MDYGEQTELDEPLETATISCVPAIGYVADLIQVDRASSGAKP